MKILHRQHHLLTDTFSRKALSISVSCWTKILGYRVSHKKDVRTNGLRCSLYFESPLKSFLKVLQMQRRNNSSMYSCRQASKLLLFFLFQFVMKSRYLRWPEPWLMTNSWPSVFLKGKVLTYSPQLPYWDIRVSQTTFTQLGQLWRTEQIMPAPLWSPIQLLTLDLMGKSPSILNCNFPRTGEIPECLEPPDC